MPGEWSWELAYRRPLDLRWTLHTWGEDQVYLLEDGRVSYRLGSATLPVPPEAGAGLLTQARWLAAVSLDALRDPAIATWTELPRAELPPDAVRGIAVRFAEGGSPYHLHFDADDRLVMAEGEVSLAPIGEGRLRVRFHDFRDTEGYLLPYHATYELDGRPFLDEEVMRYAIEPG
jgi:hypothetical protein